MSYEQPLCVCVCLWERWESRKFTTLLYGRLWQEFYCTTVVVATKSIGPDETEEKFRNCMQSNVLCLFYVHVAVVATATATATTAVYVSVGSHKLITR